jgi:hypothetical protein
MSQTLRDAVAAHFRAHPNEWVDSQLLAKLAGHGGWRTRKNECERQLGMRIINRQYRRNGFTVSEYKFEPQARLFEGAA